MNLLHFRAPEFLSKYYGETEAAIRRAFEHARSAAPCVLIFDEFDALAHKR